MANIRFAVYPAGTGPYTYTIGSGWSGSPVYTDSETAPAAPATHQFMPDVSGLSASTEYAVYVVWEDGATVVGPVSAVETTLAAGVSGSLLAIEVGGDSASFLGAVRVSGNFTAAESGSDTGALQGNVKVSGTLSAQEVGSDTGLLIGGNFAIGSFFAQETGSDSAIFVGKVPVLGSFLAQESGSDVGNFTGNIPVRGGFTASESGSDLAAFAGSALGSTVSITTAQAKLLFQIYLLHQASATSGRGNLQRFAMQSVKQVDLE